MTPALTKLQLCKELDKYHGFASELSRQDLTSGAWFARFLERVLGARTTAVSPADVQRAFPKTSDENLGHAVTWRAVNAAILATDAYDENLTSTEVRTLTASELGGEPQRLSGDSQAIIAEVLYVLSLITDLIFELAAVHRKRLDTSKTDLFYDLFGYSLGRFDWERKKAQDGAVEALGAKIYDRAIVRTVGSEHADALRKGFYCFLTKSMAAHAQAALMDQLPEWTDEATLTMDLVDDGLGETGAPAGEAADVDDGAMVFY